VAAKRDRTAYIVVFHFDSNFGLNYKDTPERRKKTINQAEWWVQRAKILKEYVLPALDAQTFQFFQVWGLFMPAYKKLAQPVLKLFKERGYNISFDGPAPIRKKYREDKLDWLGLIHHDSDDLYSRNAFRFMVKPDPALGRIVFFRQGFIYGPAGAILYVFGKPTNPPLSFHMMYYPGWALQSEAHWYGYRRRHEINVDHFCIGGAKRHVELPAGNFCQLVHGTNTVSTWKNPHLKKRLCRLITDEAEQRKILSKFGVKI
jgi:hypothetical protein